MRAGPQRSWTTTVIWWMPNNRRFGTVVLEKTLESPLDWKEIKPVKPKGNQFWIGRTAVNTLATWCKEPTLWKIPWCWKRLKAGGKGDDREWDGWMTSPTRWTWVWVDSVSWWWTGRPGVLQSMASQRVRHNWETELKWLTLSSLLFKKQSWILLLISHWKWQIDSKD